MAGILVPPAHAQTCVEPKAADFKATPLVQAGLRYPVHLALTPDGRAFIADMNSGEIRLWKPGATETVLAGKVPTRFDNEDGLFGIAMSPRFAQNGHLFAFFTTPDVVNRAHVLVRYKVDGDAVDIASGVEVLRVPRVKDGKYHAGGGMAWDGQDNLLIGTGDDTNPHGEPNDGFAAIYWKDPGKDAQKSSGNTNDLRGKVIRIPPVDAMVDGRWYTIPEGNLFKPGTPRTRAEIFAMGIRNPYRVSADPATGWVFFGEVGPDANSTVAGRGRQGHDELNVAPTAGNYGWPYCNGNNFAYNDVDYSGEAGVPGAAFDCARPVNRSPNNTGLDTLPASRAPAVWYASSNSNDWREMGQGGETSMAGPVYRYDKANPSKSKFPPEFDGRLFFWDWTRWLYKLASFDAQAKVKSLVDFPLTGAAGVFGSMISAEYGKDGSLYVLRFSKNGYGDMGNTGALFRVDYTGPINESCLPVSLAEGRPRPVSAGALGGVAGLTAFEVPEGYAGIEIYDLHGRLVHRETRGTRAGAFRAGLPAGVARGVVRGVVRGVGEAAGRALDRDFIHRGKRCRDERLPFRGRALPGLAVARAGLGLDPALQREGSLGLGREDALPGSQ